MVGAEKRNITKSKIVNYIINHEATSKVELSKDLNLSMPTVLSNVNELLAKQNESVLIQRTVMRLG